ncbi:mitochondrial carrier [Aspergillus sclerotioniger CBS 115572]|uniref:Mitochondrial thiamine pyrophosphate carrier 1 n=1 Tax=Aspergillus sclerotioniger CBS 115572 TaxID=1450535 RepID=A0A317WKY9_9EURO|nr:mitochondrial carrier [Aspergillus sclerotioniger CBS 115572]PWY87053.1 mitochondrial carrier [Aspergillus sclerotioniger CBS 115572]
MSAAISDHAQPDPSAVGFGPAHSRPTSPPLNPPTSYSQMEHVAQSRPARSPTTSDANDRLAVGTTQATAVDDASTPRQSPNGRGAATEVNKRSVDYIVRSGVAGGLAGCAAKTVVAPLDRVKILFQASNPQFAKYTGSWSGLVLAVRDIKRHEGLRGLFKGHSATLLRIFPYAGIKFLAYEQVRAVVIPSHDKETPFRRLISGSLAGITSVFFTYPLELIRVRLAFETKRTSRSSFSNIFRQIYNERVTPPPTSTGASITKAPVTATAESVASTVSKVVPSSGLTNFYRGFAPTLLGMLPYAGMSFLTHDTVGDWLRSPSIAPYTVIPESEATAQLNKGYRRSQLTAAAELFSGAIAGLVSQTSSYPLEVVRRRMQVGGVVGDGRRLGIVETARTIMLERGFRGFFVGLTIGYIKIIPMTATGFFVYERLKWSLGI